VVPIPVKTIILAKICSDGSRAEARASLGFSFAYLALGPILHFARGQGSIGVGGLVWYGFAALLGLWFPQTALVFAGLVHLLLASLYNEEHLSELLNDGFTVESCPPGWRNDLDRFLAGRSAGKVRPAKRGRRTSSPVSPRPRAVATAQPAQPARRRASRKTPSSPAPVAAAPPTPPASPPASIQELVDAAGAHCVLYPGEYQGPLRISRPIDLDFAHSTLHGPGGPVLTIEAEGVRVRNVLIEVTRRSGAGRRPEGLAVQLSGVSRVTFEKVTVKGQVAGIAGEEGAWGLPERVDLGLLPLRQEHEATVALTVPVECTVESTVDTVTLDRVQLSPGENSLRLRVHPSEEACLLQGSILVRTKLVSRCIRLAGLMQETGSP
jgi:hypothetical protein